MDNRKRSNVWYHFNTIDKKRAKCKHCRVLISSSSGSTSNLQRHIKKCHPLLSINRFNSLSRTKVVLVPKVVPDKHQTVSGSQAQPGPSTINNNEVQFNTAHLKDKSVPNPLQGSFPHSIADTSKPLTLDERHKMDEQILRMIVKEYLPLNTVEGKCFKELFQLLNSNYEMPTRAYMSNLLTAIYDREKLILINKLKNVSAVCLTTDRWTCTINDESFIAITVNYIDTNVTLQSDFIDCISYGETYTGTNIAEFLTFIAQEWGIFDKVVAVITDNTPNVVAAIEECKWRHISCFGHTLNLVMEGGLVEINEIITKVKGIVVFFQENPNSLAKLKAVQSEMINPQLKLKLAVPTYWNSTFTMLNRVLSGKTAIVATFALLNLNEHNLTSNEWDILHSAVEFLKYFDNIINEVNLEQHILLSEVILYIRSMLNHVSKFLGVNILPEIKAMAQTIKDQISLRFGDVETEEILAHCTILDPRFKNKGFTDEIKFKKMYQTLSDQVTCAQTPKSLDSASSVIELDKYLEKPLLNKLKPFDWWKANQYVHPRLFEIVLKTFCIPANSVPCERIFSKTGRNWVEQRNALKSGKLSKYLFLDSYFK